MKIRITVGNSSTGEWGEPREILLIPYSEVFLNKHPDLPTISEGFEEQFSIVDYEISINENTRVYVDAHYTMGNNGISIIVKQNNKSFVQVLGQATDESGNGLSVMFVLPGTSIPVDLCYVP